jgi:hypothetical protein
MIGQPNIYCFRSLCFDCQHALFPVCINSENLICCTLLYNTFFFCRKMNGIDEYDWINGFQQTTMKIAGLWMPVGAAHSWIRSSVKMRSPAQRPCIITLDIPVCGKRLPGVLEIIGPGDGNHTSERINAAESPSWR